MRHVDTLSETTNTLEEGLLSFSPYGLRLRLLLLVLLAASPLAVLGLDEGLWSALAFLLALAVVWLGSEVLVLRPAKALLAAARRLGAGDLSAHTGFRGGSDEFAPMAQTLDEMAAALQERSQRLEQAEAQCRALIEHISAVVDRDAGEGLGKLLCTQDLLIDISERKRMENLIRIQRDLAVALSAETDLSEALSLVLRVAVDATGMEGGAVHLADQSGHLQLAHHCGISDKLVRELHQMEPDSPTTTRLLRGETAYFAGDELRSLSARAREEGLSAVAAVPILHRGQVIAALAVASHTIEEIAPDVRETMEAIAAQVASAIARLQAQQALFEEQALTRSILDSSPNAIVVTDLRGIIVDCNQAALDMHGAASKGGLLGCDSFSLIAPEHRAAAREGMQKALETGVLRNAEYDLLRADGFRFPAELSASLVRDARGQPRLLVAILRDITERRQAEERLRFLTFHDPLSGLYNRAYFEEEIRRLEGGRSYPVTIVSADLDGLKLINDTLGHDQGDELLKAFAEVLQASFRHCDVVARIGGDEFAAILPLTDENAAEGLCQRLAAELEAYNRAHPNLPIGVSVGTATATDARMPLSETLKQADADMYVKKLDHSIGRAQDLISLLFSTLAAKGQVQEIDSGSEDSGSGTQ